MSKYLSIIRYPNLIIIFFTQLLTYQCLIRKDILNVDFDKGFLYLVIATMLIAAAGYMINDFYDVDADKVNKNKSVLIGKKIPSRLAIFLYFLFNLIALICGFLISLDFLFIFIAIILLLFLYSYKLKKIALVGNLVVALLLAFTVFVVYIFEPVEDAVPMFFFVAFSFLSGLFREIIKDIEDIEGDRVINARTLPLVAGEKTSKIVVFVIAILLFICTTFFISYMTIIKNYLAVVYFVILVLSPLVYLASMVNEAKSKSDFHKVSFQSKLFMVIGILSMLFI